MLELAVIFIAGVTIALVRACSNATPKWSWRDHYSPGPAPAWATGNGTFVSWANIDLATWDADVANNVGLVRLALKLEAALTLALPELSDQIKDEPPLVVAAALVFHLHHCVGTGITPTEATEMALMVYYDADYATDPVGTTNRVTMAPALARPCSPPSWKAPLLLALGTQLARPLVAPPALRRQHQATPSTDLADARKTE
jgi:hypothetical protein